MQQGFGYKNKYNCHFQLLFSEDRQKYIFETRDKHGNITNKIDYYWDEQEIKSLKKKLKWDKYANDELKQKKYRYSKLQREPKLQVVNTEEIR